MRGIYDQMEEWVLAQAGEDGRAIQTRVQDLNAQFEAARVANNEDSMRDVAAPR